MVQAHQEEPKSIDTAAIATWSLPHSSIAIPHKELEMFAVNGSFTSVATVFRNVSSLFPTKFQSETERLVV